jgi:hypothetical protein
LDLAELHSTFLPVHSNSKRPAAFIRFPNRVTASALCWLSSRSTHQFAFPSLSLLLFVFLLQCQIGPNEDKDKP